MFITVGLVILISIGFSIRFFNLLSERQRQQEKNCATVEAEPMPDEVVSNLCERNLIPASLSSCNDNSSPIRLQSVERIVKSNVVLGSSTYEDVSDMFGSYETYCSGVSPGMSEFTCDYHLGRWPLVRISYDDETKIVQSIRAPSCLGGS